LLAKNETIQTESQQSALYKIFNLASFYETIFNTRS